MLKKHSHARGHARKHALSSAIPHRCTVCGYTTHVQVCHIKALSEFPESASTAEINSDYNLTYLCPNHHWEFDNGYLKHTPPSLGSMLSGSPQPAVLAAKPKPLSKRRYATGKKPQNKRKA